MTQNPIQNLWLIAVCALSLLPATQVLADTPTAPMALSIKVRENLYTLSGLYDQNVTGQLSTGSYISEKGPASQESAWAVAKWFSCLNRVALAVNTYTIPLSPKLNDACKGQPSRYHVYAKTGGFASAPQVPSYVRIALECKKDGKFKAQLNAVLWDRDTLIGVFLGMNHEENFDTSPLCRAQDDKAFSEMLKTVTVEQMETAIKQMDIFSSVPIM